VVHTGVRLARRFTLLSTETVEVPGIDRFRAHDERLHRDVIVDIVTAPSPSQVRHAAGVAARVRDPRLLRILASGRERVAEDSVTYVVTDVMTGVRLSELLAERRLTARIAGAIVGDCARALGQALSEEVHHGYLSATSIAVGDNGRVTIAGLGIDGELALQAGIGRGNDEAADAMALGKIYVAAITGRESDAATERDVPEDLGTRARALCTHVMAGTGPKTLAEVLSALAPVDTRILRHFSSVVRDMPLLPRAMRAKQARDKKRTLRAVGGLTVAPDAVARADHAVQEVWAEQHSDPDLRAALAQVDKATETSDTGHDPRAEISEPDALAAQLARIASQVEPGLDEPAHAPEPSKGANELHDLYEFEEMVDVQNVIAAPSIWEAVLERLHDRWPKSETITQRLDRAHDRANRAGPIKAAPVLLPLFAIIVIVVGVVAFSMLKSPLTEDEVSPRQNTYPVFTLSPSPSVTASPTASADASDAE